MAFRKYKDYDPGSKYVLTGELLNRMTGDLEEDGKLRVAPPLIMKDGPGGKTLSIALPPGAVVLRLTTAATGAGTYNARVQQVRTNTQSTSTDLNLSAWLSDLNTSDDAVFENLAENAAAGGAHALATGANAYVVGYLAQRFASDLNMRPIYMGIVATLPVGQYQYMGYQMVSQNQGGFDFTRAHPLIG